MSEQTLAVAREIYRAFADHRFPAEHLADEFAWETNPELPGAGIYMGHEAVRAYFRDWVGGWRQVESNVERLVDRGDQVVALIHGRYRLSPKGAPFEASYAHVWTFRDGKAVHARATARPRSSASSCRSGPATTGAARPPWLQSDHYLDGYRVEILEMGA